jgi:dihydrolipoamide dehydrogenase
MERYDLVIIGGGPSGYAAAMRAIDFRKRVLLVEKDKIGGAGLYCGALSSKTMWELSNKYASLKDIKQGAAHHIDLSYKDVIDTVQAAVFDRKFQLTVHSKLLQTETLSKLFFHERGRARLAGRNEVIIRKEDGEKTVWADNIMVATGSRPRKLLNIPIDEKVIVTSDGIEGFEKFPESLVILGAGVIGCEYATIFSNFGKTKVYLIDKADRILPFEDDDLASVVATSFEKNGVTIHKNSSLVSMNIVDGKVEYVLKYNDGRQETMRVEKALLSIGRVPNTENLGLEEVGVKMDERGYIVVDDTQTSVPNIYAAGDITANIALVNVGEREGRHAVVRMFGPPVKPIVYRNISTIMFLNPEVAAVGMNEQDCAAQDIPIKVAKIDYSCIARAIAMRKTTGFFKIIVTDDEEMRILGMRAVGEHASSAIQAVALLIYMNKGIRELADMIHPHPSIIEGIQECVRMLLGKSIYKSSVFKDKLKCYRCHRGVCTPLETL